MKEEEKVIKNSLYISLAKLVSNLFLAISIIVVARLLGADRYGVYVLVMSLVGLLNSFGGFGIGPYLFSILPKTKTKNEKEKIISNALVTTFLFGGLLTIASIILMPNFVSASYPQKVQIVALASLSILFSLTFAYFNNLFIAVKRGGFSAIITVVQSFSQGIISILLAILSFQEYAPIIGLVSGEILGTIAGLVLAAKIGIRFKMFFSREEVLKIVRFGSYLIIASFFGVVSSRFALVYLSKFVTNDVIGSIGVVQNFIVVIDIIAGTVGALIVPVLASQANKARSERFLWLAFKFSALLLSYPLALMFFFPQQIVPLLFGKEYLDAVLYMKLYSCLLFLSSFSYIYSGLFYAREKTKTIAFISFIGALSAITSIVVLAQYGAVGYFASFIISAVVQNAFAFCYIKDYIAIKRSEIIKVAGALVGVGAAAYLLSLFTNRFATFIVSVIALLIAFLVALRFAITKREVEIILNAISSSRLKGFAEYIEWFWNLFDINFE